ncbi:hypothetical protein RO787_28410 [Blautia coccoides]|uniref:hypothetical protein n=1 Tax=Blautia producta TaxID=33035 RepID=UPI0028A3BEA0|nr:hypothetical protein [Blautia coccoides]MDT4377243.1 hypothetical protein [Blautia coccoides]
MINTTTEFQQAHLENSACITKASILLKDGTLFEIGSSQISQGATKIDDGVTGSNKFEIGSAIANKLTLSLNNRYDEFSDYDFTDAVVTAWVGKQLSDRIEWLKKGVYNTDDPTATPAILSLECLDNMSKFDQVYDGGIGFPATLQSIVQYCCTQCGVILVNGEFPNYRYQVSQNPFTDTTNITYRAIIAYCALLAGCYARCNTDGRLEFKWFDTAAFDGIIDGGVFDETTEASYQTGDNLDGGNFTDYTSGDNADGGTFTETLPYHHIYSFSSLSVSTEDVVITGIRVTAADSEDTAGKKIEGETYLCGAEGYVLDVSGNPLIEAGKAKDVAEYLAGRVVGMRFRPFTASAIGDPSWEAGDAAIVTDRKGNSYYTYLTNITYSTGGYASISCDAEPAARHSADRYAEINKVISDIKKDSQQKLTEYGKLLEQMNSLAVNAMGYYETQETQDDGSVITYMHDKPLLSDSKIVYKQSIDGFFWSRDGGKTWTGGIDKDGNAVMNVIAAIGLYADWIVTGKISSKNGRVYFDLDNNELVCNKVAYSYDGQKYPTAVLQIGSSQYTGGGVEGEVIMKLEGYDDSALKIFLRSLLKNDTEIRTDKGLYICAGKTDRTQYVRFNSDQGVTIFDGSYAGISVRDRGVPDEQNFENLGVSIKYLSSNCAKITRLNVSSITSSGTKSRIVDTPNYSQRLMYCYETPTPYFGDIGTAKTDENGVCFISIDDIFQETVNTKIEYTAFLQKEGPGDLWVDEKSSAFFVVKGTPDLSFSWEIKVVQRDFEHLRLDDYSLQDDIADDSIELEYIFDQELENYDREMEKLLNEDFKSISSD